MKGAVKDGCKRMRLHILTDGRGVPDGTCHGISATLKKDLDDFTEGGCDAKVASGGGRMSVTMDRYEADWGMVERGYNAHILGEAEHKFTDATVALKTLKTDDVSDQYIPAFVIVDEAGARLVPYKTGMLSCAATFALIASLRFQKRWSTKTLIHSIENVSQRCYMPA